MNNNHSPAPWTTKSQEHNYSIVYDGNGNDIAHVECLPFDEDEYPLDNKTVSNANLIATAPELLDAAIKAKSFMDERMDNNSPFDVAFYAEICRTIDKARGV